MFKLHLTQFAANLVDNGLSVYIQYINFHVQSTGTDPVVTGTNEITDQTNRLNAARMIEVNKDFLMKEATAYLDNTLVITYMTVQFITMICTEFVMHLHMI